MSNPMTHKEFRQWRKSLHLSQKEAAEALGLKRRVVQYYEKGERDGEKVDIPRAVRLACYALAQGVADYRGPSRPPVRALTIMKYVENGGMKYVENGGDAENGSGDVKQREKIPG